MARKHVPIQSEFPYHITSRCINKDWFPIPQHEVWKIMCRHLYFVSRAYNLKIHTFVLMNNHFHMIATCPDLNLGTAMQWFLKNTALDINKKAGRINQLWGGRYFRTMVQKPNYLLNTYKYDLANPLKAGITNNVLAYKYSSLPGVLGFSKLDFPVSDPYIFDIKLSQLIDWLNTPTNDNDWNSMVGALKRKKFKLRKAIGKNIANPLEGRLL